MSRDAASGPNGVFDRGLRRDASIFTHGVFPGFFAPLAGNGGAEQNRKGSHLFLDSGVNWADCDRLRATAQKRSQPWRCDLRIRYTCVERVVWIGVHQRRG